MKKLIVNADDFGLCTSVNKAIIECHLAGNINSTTLMANMPGTEEAVELSKKHTKLNLKDGWTVTTKDRRLSAQWEHTLLVTETGVEVLTARSDEDLSFLER